LSDKACATADVFEFCGRGRPPDLPTIIMITAAIRLSRENHSVRQTRSLPSVRPLTIGEVEAGFAIHIMESIVHGESAGRLV